MKYTNTVEDIWGNIIHSPNNVVIPDDVDLHWYRKNNISNKYIYSLSILNESYSHIKRLMSEKLKTDTFNTILLSAKRWIYEE